MSLLVLVACTRSEPAAQPNAASCCTNEQGTGPAAVTSGTTELREGVAQADVAVTALKVLAEVGADGVTLRVQNHGDNTVRVGSRARVAQVVDGQASLLSGVTLALAWSCDAPMQECVTLAPGAELLPPAWPVRAGEGACGPCPECAAPDPGRYRVLLTACGGDTEITSNDFELGAAR